MVLKLLKQTSFCFNILQPDSLSNNVKKFNQNIPGGLLLVIVALCIASVLNAK